MLLKSYRSLLVLWTALSFVTTYIYLYRYRSKLPSSGGGKVVQHDVTTVKEQLKIIRQVDSRLNRTVTTNIIVSSSKRYKCQIDLGPVDGEPADMLVFDQMDLDRLKTPPQKGLHDIWAFASKEPQIKLKNRKLQPLWNGLFNYSITFDRNSAASFHVFRPIMSLVTPVKKAYYVHRPQMQPVRLLWMVSHCTNKTSTNSVWSAREEYAIELSKHISINTFTQNIQNCERLKSVSGTIYERVEPVLEHYMFYLSFESNICLDYITEKFWKILESNSTTIPVALGGLSIDDYNAIAPPNSFIHVKNFTSPKALADHLKFVSENKAAFNYYHQWRNKYSLDGKNQVMWKNRAWTYHGDFRQYYCDLVHERPQRVWTNFSEEYGNHQCLDVSQPEKYCSYYNLSCNGLKSHMG